MARYISDTNQVAFLFESGTYASPTGTTPQWIGLVQNSNVDETRNVKYIRYNGNNTRNQSIAVDGLISAGGSLKFLPQNWKLLGLALGSITTTSGAATPYTHNLSELNNGSAYAFTSGPLNPFASFTLLDVQTAVGTGRNFTRQVQGCMIDTFEIAVTEGELTECNASYIAQSVTYVSGTPTAATASTLKPPIWGYWTVNVGGTALPTASSFNFRVSNNMERTPYLNGSQFTSVPYPKNRDYSLSVELDGTSETTPTLYANYFKSGVEFNMTLTMTDASAGTGSGACVITLSGCRVDPFSAPTDNSDVQENNQVLTIVPRQCSVVVNDLVGNYNPF